MDIFIYLVTAGALGGVFIYINHVQRMEQKTYNAKLKTQREMLGILNEVRDKTRIEWSLVWRAHNGVGGNNPFHPMFISVEEESYEYPFQSVWSRYKGLKIDLQVNDILGHIRQHGDYAAFASDIEKGLLGDMLRTNGATWVYIFHIWEGNDSAYFGMLATSKERTPFQENLGMEINVCVNRLQALFSRTHNSLFKVIRRTLYL